MPYSEFTPGGPSTSIADSAMSGLGTGLSLMDRVQSMRIRDQQAQIEQQQSDMRKKQFDIMLPAIAAKANADVAAATNTVSAFTQTEAMRQAAHAEMPEIRTEWMQASAINDPVERADAQNRVLGRATKYESVGELKPEIDAWKNVWASSNITARTLANSQLVSDRQRELAEMKAENDRLKQELVNTGRVDAARARGEEVRKTAEATGRGLTKAERYRNQMLAARSAGDTEAEKFYANLAAKESSSPINTTAGTAEFQQQLADVEANGTEDEKAFWRARANAINHRGTSKVDDLLKAVTTPAPVSTQRPASSAPVPTPAQPVVPNQNGWQEITLPSGQKVKIRRKG